MVLWGLSWRMWHKRKVKTSPPLCHPLPLKFCILRGPCCQCWECPALPAGKWQPCPVDSTGISGQTSKARGDLGAIHSGGRSVPRGARALRRCGLATRRCSPESLQTLVTPFRGLSEAVLSLCDWVKGRRVQTWVTFALYFSSLLILLVLRLEAHLFTCNFKFIN